MFSQSCYVLWKEFRASSPYEDWFFRIKILRNICTFVPSKEFSNSQRKDGN
ncbi:hypothetical protein LEP1GSC098_0277 [Leptospira interrogans serovar Grippotyphosa str. UI 08434]|nr:hypothetical protein LEP1GSC098_0277 [Leptospira interrogans serovar Grippotyphosa str. UI 08434]